MQECAAASWWLLTRWAESRSGSVSPWTASATWRPLTFGHVRQLDAVAFRLLVNLAAQAPLLPGGEKLAYVDVDDTFKQTYGYAKQGAGRGHTSKA